MPRRLQQLGLTLFWKVSVIATCALVFEVGSNFLYWLETGKIYLIQHVGTAATTQHRVVTKLHPYFGFINVLSPDYVRSLGLAANNFDFPQYADYV